MKKISLALLSTVLLLAGGLNAPAQQADSKTVLTVAFSGYDALVADVNLVGKLGGQPNLAQGLEMMLQMSTGGQGVNGLDKSKPWGAVVQADQAMGFPVLVFLPVTDIDKLLGLYTMASGQQPPAPEDGIYTFEDAPQTLYATKSGDWVFLSTTKDALANAPSDPLELLGDLHTKYDLAVTASVQNVPAPLRQMVMAQMQQGAQANMQPMPGESDEDFQLRTKMTKQMMDQLLVVFNDLDKLTLGFAVDNQTETAYLDVEVTAVPGSETAAAFAQMTDATSDYVGVTTPDAAVTGVWAGTLADSDVAQSKASIASARASALRELEKQDLPADKLDVAKQVINDLLDVAEQTIENRKADGAVSLTLGPDAATLVAGGLVVNGDKLESVVKRLAEVLQKDEPDLAQLIQLDLETYQGLRLHQVTIPVGDPKISRFVGEMATIVLAVNNKSVFLGAGRDALASVKAAIDRCKAQPGQSVPPMRVAVAVTPILKFAAAANEDPQFGAFANMLVEKLAASEGKDHLTLTSSAVANGGRVRLEIEGGLLGVLPTVGPAMGMLGGGADMEMEESMPGEASPF